MDLQQELVDSEDRGLGVQIQSVQVQVMELSLQEGHQGSIEQLAIDPMDQSWLESHPQDLQNQ